MSGAQREAEIRANWDRAKDSLRAAQILLDSGYPDIAAARAYYAAFYAACALLLSEGKEFSKHSGVVAAIHKDYVRSRAVPAGQGAGKGLRRQDQGALARTAASTSLYPARCSDAPATRHHRETELQRFCLVWLTLPV